MAFATWLRALNAVGTVAEATRLFRGATGPSDASPSTVHEPDAGGLETRLANVVVAALREAFDRDRARFDLEREFHEAEQARKEQALRLEWLRQTGTYALAQTRQLAMLSIVVWMASAAAAGWLAPLSVVAKSLLGLGWLGLTATVCAAFVAHQHLTTWLARSASATPPRPDAFELSQSTAQTAMPWVFVIGLALTAASLLLAF